IRLALHGQKLGKRVFLVLEKLSELAPILDIAAQEGLTPNLGVRLKLVSSGSGKWEDSGGDRSKFGLTASDLLEVVAALKKAKLISSFKLVHIHLGSQLTNIRRIKEAIREATRIFVELRRLGCPVEYVDFGGGLGVDYDGSRNTGGFSMNYTEQEYANDIVGAVAEACRAGEISAPPTIMTESGRALSAHHCMLAVRVVETASYDSDRPAEDAREDKPETLEKLEKILAGINRRNYFEFWHDALHLRDEANDLFKMGSFSLLDRASVDGAFWKIARRVEGILAREKRIPEDFEPLRTLLADKYYCNFSVFQSLPDSWAMLQEFPVVPLHRLTEFPTRRGILQDITCDADGQLRNYIGPAGQQSTVALHPLKSGEPYYIGIFLTGAYQEILGEYHNLFGETNVIHVALGGAGGWHYEQAIDGEKIAQVLEFAQFQRHALIDRIERQVRGSIKAGQLTSLEGREIREFYLRALDGLTYLEPAAEKKTEKRAGARAAAG
ncbi:MAG: biosynthetic arginine decarboxylase, partial [bacterium]